MLADYLGLIISNRYLQIHQFSKMISYGTQFETQYSDHTIITLSRIGFISPDDLFTRIQQSNYCLIAEFM